jgi:serine/threonine-protein kinase HipA
MDTIKVKAQNQKSGELFYEEDKDIYGFNYSGEVGASPISLTMPCRPSTYNRIKCLHPIFDMNMPEGYLFEMLKNHLSKQYGVINDFLVFSYLCNNIDGRLSYQSNVESQSFVEFDLNEVLCNDSEDTFFKLVRTYLGKNAISGVQPKTLALINDKDSLSTKEYIIKTWGVEYPDLALNEYFCLQAVQDSGVATPNVRLSDNNKFLLVERFNFDQANDRYYGFEEVLTLLGKDRKEKYNGSYEQVVKIIYDVVDNKNESIEALYKTIVMSYLLKNGDAHLKNFGVLYDEDMTNIRYAPAYDIVNTCVYFYKDRPALTMFGKKTWFGRKELIKFAVQTCFLSETQANHFYDECIQALKASIGKLKYYIANNKAFENIGLKMIDTWELSLDQNSYKEVPVEITRNWSKN